MNYVRIQLFASALVYIAAYVATCICIAATHSCWNIEQHNMFIYKLYILYT